MEAEQILAFGKWGAEGIAVADPGLQGYLVLEPRFVPKTGAKYAGNRFHKSKVFIVERLINKMMVPGHKAKRHKRSSGDCTGKAATNYKIVENAFAIIEKKTGQNPIKIFVQAIENSAPREEIVTIEYGGARYPKAVDCAPQRRIDLVLRYLSQGAHEKSFLKKRKIDATLADEIILAANGDAKAWAIQKKQELERQADSSR